jgi:hypothetical protein
MARIGKDFKDELRTFVQEVATKVSVFFIVKISLHRPEFEIN